MPTSRDLKNRGSAQNVLPHAVISSDTTTNGTAVDAEGLRSVLFIISMGAYDDGTFTPNMQESDDNSTFTELDAVNRIGAETALSVTNAIVTIGAHPTKRYVRCQIVSASTTSGAIIGITALKQTS